MRTVAWLGVLTSAVCMAGALTGCAVDPQQQSLLRDPAQHDLIMAQTYYNYFDEAAANAVVRQASIFPYHFEPRTAMLNDLGRRELEILATYLRTFPGEVRMPRAGADEALYAARARAVMSFLSEREVKADAVTIVDRQPDGDGMASYRVVEALAAENQTDKNNGRSGSFEIPILVPGRSNASTSMRNSK